MKDILKYSLQSWGDGSVAKVYATQAWGAEFGLPAPREKVGCSAAHHIYNPHVKLQRQVEPGASLARHSLRNSDLQAQGRYVSKHIMKSHWEGHPSVSPWCPPARIQANTYTLWHKRSHKHTDTTLHTIYTGITHTYIMNKIKILYSSQLSVGLWNLYGVF